MEFIQALRLKNGDKLYRNGKHVANLQYETLGHGTQACRRWIIAWLDGQDQLITDSPNGLKDWDYRYIANAFNLE